MLKPTTRRQLKEHGWLEIKKRHSNPPQALKRFVREGINSIDDLVLFTEQLPTNTLKDIFTYANIDKLIGSILNHVDDSRRIQLAALFVKIGIETSISHYRSKIEQNPVLNEPIISQLKKAADICKEISFKVKIPHIKAAEEKEDLFYLFNWSAIEEIYSVHVDSIQGKDTNEFIRFCCHELASAHIITNIVHNILRPERFGMPNHLFFTFIDLTGEYLRGELIVSTEEKIANFTIQRRGEIVLERTLVAKKEDEGVCIYKKK